jgi:hypothetical protein
MKVFGERALPENRASIMPDGRASSSHLFWQMPGAARNARLVDVSAVLEVVVPPSVSALYFWALQVDFVDSRGIWGGGHTGLQWNRRYPGSTAVNWGGYASAERGGAVLPGSISGLPGFDDDPNTVGYPWLPGRPYRLRVHRSPDVPGAWRAEVTDVVSSRATVVRDIWSERTPRPGLIRRLFSGGRGAGEVADEPGFLVRPMVWSEVFAECDDPSVTVRWSELQAVDEAGRVWLPDAVAVNYQPGRDGGCPNTNSVATANGGFTQVTNTRRLVPQGARIPADAQSPPPQ